MTTRTILELAALVIVAFVAGFLTGGTYTFAMLKKRPQPPPLLPADAEEEDEGWHGRN